MRDCPSFPAAQQATARSGLARDSELSKSSAPRRSVLNEPNPTFKRDGTAVLHESPPTDVLLSMIESSHSTESLPQRSSPVQVIDTALPAMIEEATPEIPRMQLICVLVAVQT